MCVSDNPKEPVSHPPGRLQFGSVEVEPTEADPPNNVIERRKEFAKMVNTWHQNETSLWRAGQCGGLEYWLVPIAHLRADGKFRLNWQHSPDHFPDVLGAMIPSVDLPWKQGPPYGLLLWQAALSGLETERFPVVLRAQLSRG